VVTLARVTRRKQAPKDLTGIRQHGSTYQVWISGGYDPVTGRQLFLTGSSDHLSSTYRKLNIHTRDQLATAMTAHTPPSTP
jgi:hypothetical protein